ncbi:MAG: MBL fold metallo-hydrolase [Myxococcales bacterium]|nr:MBL fold metallo-hydrolase [Myxococcales bacterium]
MQRLQRRVRLGGGALAALALAAAACGRPALVAPTVEGGPSPCGADGRGVALQVLGSGGPIADDRRASSGYLVWSEGEARALVDVGGGVFQRFAASGASLDDLEVIVLSHLHVDHSGDLPALVKSGVFGDRGRPLPLVGPDGGELFPALGAFLAALFGPQGAYPYLGGALAGEGLRLEPREVAVAGAGASFELPGLRLRVVGVPHGVVPALGARIDVGGVSIAFTGDQRMDDPRFAAMIAGVDLLVAHHAIPEESGAPARALHATPSAIGALAADAGVRHLVLSHHMLRSLRALDRGIAEIRRRYRGPLTLADDLVCVPVPISALDPAPAPAK